MGAGVGAAIVRRCFCDVAGDRPGTTRGFRAPRNRWHRTVRLRSVAVNEIRPRYAPEVAAALDGGAAVVALESTLVAHGLPRPDNLRVARHVEQVVRQHGAVPATIGMIGGQLCVGLSDAELTYLAEAPDVR